MSLFDPLGFLSNFLIYMKILLQEIWTSKMDWDEELSSTNLIEKWKQWIGVLPEVENVKVPRLYSQKMSPNAPNSIRMHVFVDASEDALTAVVYLRIEDNEIYGIESTSCTAKVHLDPKTRTIGKRSGNEVVE